jgi:hypothetical protein
MKGTGRTKASRYLSLLCPFASNVEMPNGNTNPLKTPILC